MFKDEEAKKCEKYIRELDCEMCKKLVEDCKNETGIYNYFKDRKLKLRKIDEKYVKKSIALIRTHPVCGKHFKVIKKDNDQRYSKGMEITKELDLLKYRRSNI